MGERIGIEAVACALAGFILRAQHEALVAGAVGREAEDVFARRLEDAMRVIGAELAVGRFD